MQRKQNDTKEKKMNKAEESCVFQKTCKNTLKRNSYIMSEESTRAISVIIRQEDMDF